MWCSRLIQGCLTTTPASAALPACPGLLASISDVCTGRAGGGSSDSRIQGVDSTGAASQDGGHAPGPSHAPDHYHTNPCGLRNLFWCRESRRTRGEQPRRTAAAAGSKPPDRPGQRNSIRQRAGRGETPGTGQVPFLLASSWIPTRHLCGLAAVVTVGCFGHVKVPGAGTLIRAACLLLVGCPGQIKVSEAGTLS